MFAHLKQHSSLWITAIRDSFISLLPLTFLGVAAILVRDFPLQPYQTFMTELWGVEWHQHMQVIISASHGLFGLTLSMLVATHLSQRLPPLKAGIEGTPSLIVALSALTNFMLHIVGTNLHWSSKIGHEAMFVGIICGIFSAELLRRLSAMRWLSFASMPYDTEVTFYHSIRLSLPLIMSGLIVLSLSAALSTAWPSSVDMTSGLVAWAQTHTCGLVSQHHSDPNQSLGLVPRSSWGPRVGHLFH